MSKQAYDNTIDDRVDDEIFECLKLDDPKSFFLFAGAGSGKTRSLVNVLSKLESEYGRKFRQERKKVATITYTNAAADEITHRLKHSSIFHVSTIHSFAWDLIKPLTQDIKEWLIDNLKNELVDLEDKQGRSRNLNNKTSIDRARKIESKKRRLQNLDKVEKFTYNPNGDNISKDSLNHTEVISIAAYFITHKELMQQLIICKYPIILIDESQDTKKELIDAFFQLQANYKKSFSLGLFGDTMQRIYTDGKEGLGESLSEDILTPAKRMNHRSNKRIITLINDIRKDVDHQVQLPRTEKEEGLVRLFICKRGEDKTKAEEYVANEMSALAKDPMWHTDADDYKVKTLILEHHMAARRMGFLDFFKPLYKVDRLKTGLLDGSLGSVNFFTNIVLPLVEAKSENDKFEIARIVKIHSRFLRKEVLLDNPNQLKLIEKTNQALSSLFSLFHEKDPTLLEVLKNIYHSNLFTIPESLLPIASRSDEQEKLQHVEDESPDELLMAWDEALSCSFSEIKKYNDYLSESSRFGTHQGVKGLEYDRVMVIIDDEEAAGFLFSYDKLFGAKGLTNTDIKNIGEGKETGIDRTNRLFYVACSRAKESLAVVAYTDNVEAVHKKVIDNNWFKEEEIELV
jgi:DNA helicase-2/ATP-dependent DNA helicase PcrA